MQSKRYVLLPAALICSGLLAAADFDLLRILAVDPPSAGNVKVEVSTKGDPLNAATLQNPKLWLLQVTSAGDNPVQITLNPTSVSYDAATKIVTLNTAVQALNGIDPVKAAWNVVFTPPGGIFNATLDKTKSGALTAAKARDDADIYVAGSYLAGVATKPIWMIDAKVGYADKTSNIPLIKSIIPAKTANVRMGIYGEVSTNTDAKPPNDRSEIDPDSIRVYTKLFGTQPIGAGILYGLNWEAQLAGGEFSRDNPSSNFISGGKLRFVMPFPAAKVDLIPMVGAEFGKNLNKPAQLFDRPVDLSKYDAIRRLLGGADAHYYVFRRKITKDDVYAFVLSGSWQARVPFSSEPFTRSEFLPDNSGAIKRQKVVSMRRNTRHYVLVDATWNVNKLLGIQLEYKYGSLPPLFELVNHQVTVGFVFKSKYTGWHSFQ